MRCAKYPQTTVSRNEMRCYSVGMNEDIRDAARHRIKARRGFWNMLLVFGVVVVILNVIWLVSGSGSYWPMWPMIGLGIATLFTAINVFGMGNRPITDADIDREVRKRGGDAA